MGSVGPQLKTRGRRRRCGCNGNKEEGEWQGQVLGTWVVDAAGRVNTVLCLAGCDKHHPSAGLDLGTRVFWTGGFTGEKRSM